MNGGDEVAAAPAGPPQPLEWKFSQVFGERTAGEEVQEGNLIHVCIFMFLLIYRFWFIWIQLIFLMFTAYQGLFWVLDPKWIVGRL